VLRVFRCGTIGRGVLRRVVLRRNGQEFAGQSARPAIGRQRRHQGPDCRNGELPRR